MLILELGYTFGGAGETLLWSAPGQDEHCLRRGSIFQENVYYRQERPLWRKADTVAILILTKTQTSNCAPVLSCVLCTRYLELYFVIYASGISMTVRMRACTCLCVLYDG